MAPLSKTDSLLPCVFKQTQSNLSFASAFVFFTPLSSLVKLTGSVPLGVVGEGASSAVQASELLCSKVRMAMLLDGCGEI